VIAARPSLLNFMIADTSQGSAGDGSWASAGVVPGDRLPERLVQATAPAKTPAGIARDAQRGYCSQYRPSELTPEPQLARINHDPITLGKRQP